MKDYELRCPDCKAEDHEIMGHEVPEIYDGILYWSCMGCGFAWPRDWETPYRKVMAQVYAQRHNDAQAAKK